MFPVTRRLPRRAADVLNLAANDGPACMVAPGEIRLVPFERGRSLANGHLDDQREAIAENTELSSALRWSESMSPVRSRCR